MRKRTLGRVGLALGALAILAPAGAGATPLSYSFDSSAQGWTLSQNGGPTGTAVTPHGTGGNPGGYISGIDTGTESGCPNTPANCQLFWFYSPQVPGPLSANYGGAFSFDLNSSATPNYPARPTITDSGGNVLLGAVTDPGTGWQHLSEPLTEAGWGYCPSGSATCTPATQAQFKSVLASAVYTDILVDVHDGTTETYGLDNVTLTDAPPPPAPVTHKKKCKRKRGHKASAAKKKCKKKKK